MLTVAGCHPVDDQSRHFVGRQADAEVFAQIPGPFRRAHAHELALGVRSPVAAPFPDQFAAHPLPYRLGVDQHAVQVEYDRLDHLGIQAVAAPGHAPRPFGIMTLNLPR